MFNQYLKQLKKEAKAENKIVTGYAGEVKVTATEFEEIIRKSKTDAREVEMIIHTFNRAKSGTECGFYKGVKLIKL